MSDLLNPDMPADELRLHMGELTAGEERAVRAAIRWANTVALDFPSPRWASLYYAWKRDAKTYAYALESAREFCKEYMGKHAGFEAMHDFMDSALKHELPGQENGEDAL